MPFGLTGLAASLIGPGPENPLSGLTDSGSAISGATLGPVTVGGLNPLPPGPDLTTVAVGVGIAVAVVFAVRLGRR